MARLRRRKAKNDTDLREEVLRPCRSLGYDRDRIGLYLLERGAIDIAETQFRRAVWLNPFEPRFRVHMSLCLSMQGRHEDAVAYLSEISEEQMDEHMRSIVRSFRERNKKTSV